MDQRGRLAILVPTRSPPLQLPGDDQTTEMMKTWHVDSRAELVVILSSIPTGLEAFYLALWEGADFELSPWIKFLRLYNAKSSEAWKAKEHLVNTGVPVVLPIVPPDIWRSQRSERFKL